LRIQQVKIPNKPEEQVVAVGSAQTLEGIST
jgi:hypothetical protein